MNPATCWRRKTPGTLFYSVFFLFKNIALRHGVIGFRRFEGIYCLHLQGTYVLGDEALRRRHYVSSQRRDMTTPWHSAILEERNPQLNRCYNLKTRIVLLSLRIFMCNLTSLSVMKERMRKETVVAYFKALRRHLLWQTEGEQDKWQSGRSVAGRNSNRTSREQEPQAVLCTSVVHQHCTLEEWRQSTASF